MSYYNSHQRAYIESLSKIPPEEKCWCGWYSLGKCTSCPEGRTAAEKLATQCEECGNWLYHPDDKELVHRIHCSNHRRGSK